MRQPGELSGDPFGSGRGARSDMSWEALYSNRGTLPDTILEF